MFARLIDQSGTGVSITSGAEVTVFWRKKGVMPEKGRALPGRAVAVQLPSAHQVLGRSLVPPYPEGSRKILFGMGCFWGAERLFWQIPGVYVTAVGYAGGETPNPTYEEVCSGLTGHAEVVLVVYQPEQVALEQLLAVFWESHDPTQGMRQGNDIGTQYRSVIFAYDPDDTRRAMNSAGRFQHALMEAGIQKPLTTEISDAPDFYFAEAYHQQYLAKNPQGYCGLRGLDVRCP